MVDYGHEIIKGFSSGIGKMRKQQMNLNPADDVPEEDLPYADVELPTELEEVENE